MGFQPSQSVMNLLSRHISERSQRRHHSKDPRICTEKLSLPQLCSHHEGILLPCTSQSFRDWDKSQSVSGSHALCPCCSSAPLFVSSSFLTAQRSSSSVWCCHRHRGTIPASSPGWGQAARRDSLPSFYEQKVGCSPLHMNCKVIKNLTDVLDIEG